MATPGSEFDETRPSRFDPMGTYYWGWILAAVILFALAAWAIMQTADNTHVPAPAPINGPVTPVP